MENTTSHTRSSEEKPTSSRSQSEAVFSSTTTTAEVPEQLRCCKIGRVAQKYGLQEYLTHELGNDWESPSGASLREIERKFNYRILRTKIADTGETPLEGEVKDIYESLLERDVTKTATNRAERRLTEYGVDCEELTSDFISYKTVDRHFKNCENRSRKDTKTSDSDAVESAVDRIRALENRLQIVSKKTVEDLASTGRIPLGDFQVTVNSRVTCNECENQFPISEVMNSGCPTCNTGNSE